MKPRSTLIYILMSIINYSLAVLGLLMYRRGIFIVAPVLILAQIILAVLNAIAADTMKHHIILSVHLLIASILANLAYAFAYYAGVGYGGFAAVADGENFLLLILMICVGCFLVGGLSALGIVLKNIYRAGKNNFL